MHSQRASAPTSSERTVDRPPNPGDAVYDFIEDLRAGDESVLFTELDAVEVAEQDKAVKSLRLANGALSAEAHPGSLGTPQPVLPPVLQRIFGSDAEDELMAVAKLLDPKNRRALTLVFHTPIGDVRTSVNWSSCEPEHLHRVQDLLLILVRTSAVTFAPNPGAELEISFAEFRDHPRLKVLCLAHPMQLYPGVAIDLLCFMPQTESVEKNGQLKDGAPSSVSGLPSTRVDADGEPLLEGEKSASVSPSVFAKVKDELGVEHAVEDFDRPRDGNARR